MGYTAADWQWVLGVNLWGVIHGIRVFVPRMLQQDAPGHIVNTASVAGLISPPWLAAYNVSKHAVVALSETLRHELAARGSGLKVSVLCPAWVNTGISDSTRSRPPELRSQGEHQTPADLAREQAVRQAVQSGRVTPAQVADAVFDGVKQEKFYILTHPKIKGAIQSRMECILQERNPANPMP